MRTKRIMPVRPGPWIALALIVGLPAGCSRELTPSPAIIDLAARNADVEACVACGMVVREQPAPRGQVIYRDGTRAFLCSLGDLLQYLQEPSPHGRPRAIFTEVMRSDHPLENLDSGWQPWHQVSELAFVIDIDRPGIMGAPVMAYAHPEAARQAAEMFHGEVVNFTLLQERFAQ